MIASAGVFGSLRWIRRPLCRGDGLYVSVPRMGAAWPALSKLENPSPFRLEMKAAQRGNLDMRIATGAAASTLLLLRAGLL